VIRNAIIIDAGDNIATVLRDVAAGEDVVAGQGDETVVLVAAEPIPFGHKVAVRAIAKDEEILKYAAVIGAATQDIAKGMHVHVQNVVSLRGRGDLESREN
jgi:altronate dehydratase small subunit